MSFCTAVNCMDGRVQVPVMEYLKHRFGVDYVDVITEPGPNLILAGQDDVNLIDSLFKRIDISVHQHGSVGIGVVGHHDCAGNPAGREEQTGHTHAAIKHLTKRYGDLPVIGLWVDENWEVTEVK